MWTNTYYQSLSEERLKKKRYSHRGGFLHALDFLSDEFNLANSMAVFLLVLYVPWTCCLKSKFWFVAS